MRGTTHRSTCNVCGDPATGQLRIRSYTGRLVEVANRCDTHGQLHSQPPILNWQPYERRF